MDRTPSPGLAAFPDRTMVRLPRVSSTWSGTNGGNIDNQSMHAAAGSGCLEGAIRRQRRHERRDGLNLYLWRL
jgi:hypothetical protein